MRRRVGRADKGGGGGVGRLAESKSDRVWKGDKRAKQERKYTLQKNVQSALTPCLLMKKY